jgi:hypothetical protein
MSASLPQSWSPMLSVTAVLPGPMRTASSRGYEPCAATKTPWGCERQTTVGYVFEWQLANTELQDEISHWMELGLAVAFIVAASDESRLIARLKSRLLVVDFCPTPEEHIDLMKQAIDRLRIIAKQAEAPVEDKQLEEIASSSFPDFRRAVNQLFLLSMQKLPNLETPHAS